MPHRFNNGDPIFYTPKEEEFQNLKGIYTVLERSKDGTTYRIVDKNKDFTDVDESEIEHLIYAVFKHSESGWPIIVPTYDEPLYKSFNDSEIYKFFIGGTARLCIVTQLQILKKLEEGDTSG